MRSDARCASSLECSKAASANAWARLHAARNRQPVYAYRFERRAPFPDASRFAGWGASHFAELWYMSDHLAQAPWPWESSDRRLAFVMSHFWVNFVQSGQPNGEVLPRWDAFTNARPLLMRLGDTRRMGAVPGLDQLQVFDAVYTALRGAPFGRP